MADTRRVKPATSAVRRDYKQLFVLLACLFVVMIGLGITMPVLPFYVERLALAEGVSRESVVAGDTGRQGKHKMFTSDQ